MDRLAAEWGDTVQVVQIDINDGANQALVRRLAARLTPTFVLLDVSGQEVWRSVGTINSDEVNRAVEALADEP